MKRNVRLWRRIRKEWDGVPLMHLVKFAKGYQQRNGYSTLLEALEAMTF